MDAINLYQTLCYIYAPQHPDKLVERERAILLLKNALVTGIDPKIIIEAMVRIAARKNGYDCKMIAHVEAAFWHYQKSSFIERRFDYSQR